MAYVNAYVENYQPEVRQAGALKTKLPIVAQAGAAIVAGGNVNAAIQTGPAAGPNIYTGSGAPTINAPQGSIYLNTTGSTVATRLYVCGAANAWVAVTTVS